MKQVSLFDVKSISLSQEAFRAARKKKERQAYKIVEKLKKLELNLSRYIVKLILIAQSRNIF